MSGARVSCAAVVGAALLVSCGRPSVPGDIHEIRLQVAFADLPQTLLEDIGSFHLELIHDEERFDYALSFSSESKKFTWLEEPGVELPTTGTLSVRLEARDIDDRPLVPFSVGGSAGPIDLSALAADAPMEIPILAAQLGTFTPLPQAAWLKQARFLHSSATASNAGVLIVGGATGGTPDAPLSFASDAEWIDPFAGQVCTSGGVGTCEGWGDIPGERVHHIAVSLGEVFDPSCPSAGSIVVGLGEDNLGNALSDLFLFDPDKLHESAATFTELTGLGLTARIGAVAYATRDCRVVIAGGHGGDSTPLTLIEAVRFGSDGVSRDTKSATWSQATSYATAFRLDNDPDEVILVAGLVDDTTAAAAAVSVANKSGQLDLCPLDQNPNACNGSTSSLTCARARPAAARLGASGTVVSALIVGAAQGSCFAANAEIFRSGLEQPYNHFLTLSGQPAVERAVGHTVDPLGDTMALVVGGMPPGATFPTDSPTDSVEKFALTSGLTDTAASAVGEFETLAPLSNPTAFHATSRTAHFILIVGGLVATGPTSHVGVFVPEF